ncbi:LOW QUALITY PROTEIN: hypothetical protein MAR_003039, partial [Mya arenaria]
TNQNKCNSTVFTCESCEKPVTWSCKGVECEGCFIWYHADCQNINSSMYDCLGESFSNTDVWKCLACENINITSSSLQILDSYETSNPYEPLNASNSDNISFSLVRTSTPKSKQQSSLLQNIRIKSKDQVLVVNCRSIVDKKNEYENLIHSTKPDIVIGTESWLKPKHYDNEFLIQTKGIHHFVETGLAKLGVGGYSLLSEMI